MNLQVNICYSCNLTNWISETDKQTLTIPINMCMGYCITIASLLHVTNGLKQQARC